ncbi:MAG: 6-phosphofructokinase, partial [Clostridia bacterium]|nr:6-phosphofructokinase [Clostridia bacterium]
MAKNNENKKLAVLTSGGDASGMNACIRTVVRYGMARGFEVYGIKHGYKGLLNDEISLMDYKSVSNSVHAGGTILRSARCLEFKEKDVMLRGADNLLKRDIH